MSNDWNKKLHLIFRECTEPMLDTLELASHRSKLVAESSDNGEAEVSPRLDWLVAAADRIPSKLLATGGSELDGSTPPVVTHPLSCARRDLSSLDVDGLRQQLGEILERGAKAHPGDARLRFLWMWRYLADELGESAGAEVHRYPADPRVPDISLWQALGVTSAMATAEPEPMFLVVHLGPARAFVAQAAATGDLAAGAQLLSWLAWQAMLPVVESLGPDAVLFPSLRYQPLVDEWLSEQGVAALGTKADRVPLDATLPSEFVALVPQARVEELGKACVARVHESWQAIADKTRELLEGQAWCDSKDVTWQEIWRRQTKEAFSVTWTAIRWAEDSTGAGGLVPKQEVTALEKWAKVHQETSGSEDEWPGIFYGLWYAAALSASVARRRTSPGPIVAEGLPRCSMCGQREVLHARLDLGAKAPAREVQARDFWERIAGWGGQSQGRVRSGEQLCSVCLVKRQLYKVRPDLDQSVPSSSLMAVQSALRASGPSAVGAWEKFQKALPTAEVESSDEAAAEALWSERALAALPSKGKTAALRAREAVLQSFAPGLAPSFALVLAVGDHQATLLRGGKERKHGSYVHDLLHRAWVDPLSKTRGAGKELLDAIAPLGPSRHTSVNDALRDFSVGSVPTLVRNNGGFPIYMGSDRVVAVVPAENAIETARALRERYREHFTEIERGSTSARLAIHPGPSATLSAVVAFATHQEHAGALLRDCEQLLVRSKNGAEDTVVVMVRSGARERRVFSSTWDTFDTSLSVVLRAFKDPDACARLTKEIRRLEPALTNPDVERAGVDGRVSLVRALLARFGLAQEDDEAVARALCQVVDRTSTDPDGARPFDGLHIVKHLVSVAVSSNTPQP